MRKDKKNLYRIGIYIYATFCVALCPFTDTRKLKGWWVSDLVIYKIVS